MRIGKSILVLLVMVLFAAGPALAKYGGGSGTAANPYLIYTAGQMNEIGANQTDWSKYFKLMADIDLSMFDGREGRPAFNIIGYYINGVGSKAFTGSFDGNGHTISNFTYNSSSGNDTVGLFGYVNASGAKIKNLTLCSVDVNATTWMGTGALIGEILYGNVESCSVQGGNVSAEDAVGGLVGFSWYGVLSNCVSGVSVSGQWSVGGLVGSNGSDNVSDCQSACSVTGNYEAGGLIGENSGSVVNCSSTGTVNVTVRSAGGLIGSNSGTVSRCCSFADAVGNQEVGGLVGRNLGQISNCYARGSVSGSYDVGGLVGLYWDTPSHDAVISNSYSTGSSNYGGLVGYNIDGVGVISASFWDIQASGTGWSDGGTGKMTADMKTKSTFTGVGWDFVGETANGTEDIWNICEGTNYPRLVWQIPPPDFVCPDGVDFRDFAIFTSYWLKDTK